LEVKARARQTAENMGRPQQRFYIQERILTSHEKARQLWRGSRDRARQRWQGHNHHAPLYRHKQDAQVCSHCPLPGVLKTDERAAWPPTPPGGQVMTSLRPNLFGVIFFWFFRVFFAGTWPTLTRSLVLVVTWEFDKVCEILTVIFFPGGGIWPAVVRPPISCTLLIWFLHLAQTSRVYLGLLFFVPLIFSLHKRGGGG
jgi:hypothetical protein